jgi:hypothetical protein
LRCEFRSPQIGARCFSFFRPKHRNIWATKVCMCR